MIELGVNQLWHRNGVRFNHPRIPRIYSWVVQTGEAGYTEFLKGWAGALEGAYEAYLDGEYFEHQEEMAIRHERYSELLTKFIEKLK